MKIKILQTALLISIISMSLGTYTANAELDFISNYELMFIDHYDNGNIQNSNYATNGSRAYGYLYRSLESETKYRNPYLYTNTESYKVPEWFCMTAEGLPTLLPQTNFKDQRAWIGDIHGETEYQPITLNDLIDATKEKDHFDLNKVTKVEADESGRNVFTFEDGQTLTSYINPSDPHIFHYSTNGTDWIGYNNRDEVNLPENTCITDFKLPNHSVLQGAILAYNMKVVDIDILSLPVQISEYQLMPSLDDTGYQIVPVEKSYPAIFHKLPDIQEVCQEINITANVKKVPETKKPIDPVTVTTPTSTSSPSGPGGISSSSPTVVTPITTPLPPSTPAPVLVSKCENIIKNLDDTHLLEYYKKLQLEELGLNVRDDISRIELIRLMINAGYLQKDNTVDMSVLNNFVDIAKNAWYAPYVAKLIQRDIVSSQDFKNNEQNLKLFNTYGNIAREDAIKILANIITEKNLRLPTLDEIVAFSDVKNTDKNADYIQYAYNNCLLHGRKTIDGNPIGNSPRVFEAKSNITIAETAKILFNGQDLRK